ncbi:MAG TPA: T9SS type A sorting domain-containing protein [Flavobacteriaceae bacterium]|nr:T9SS type A sorting domain-containing protein [Flavobacteriaceae bacterium]MCB9212421.1 T9SS type A sorting domain-containing protein [Alteromonas sp.]HPF11697.1 T9SS type A sorting domain-containing protein [Flavobacteriaceae bacterium]HQU20172.1 T9SS type A sorting domain-containing protein [Flavobacteriaceae bacterium]HQU64739.1 T9SS type A sorting domain-containing protein [Flavobacteriaceae bacterium]
MKKRLLYLLIGFSFFEGFAQVANSADDIVICEVPYDGFATFDLTVNDAQILGTQNAMDYGVYYYQTLADADANINQILNTTFYGNIMNPQEIYSRVIEFSSNNLSSIINFNLVVGQGVNPLIPTPLAECDDDNDGYAAFDLTEKDAEIANGDQDVTVRYYFTLQEAEAAVPGTELASPYFTAIPFSQIVWARVTKEDPPSLWPCWDVVPLELLVNPTPLPPSSGFLEVLIAIDEDHNGVEFFDLTQNEAAIFGNNTPVFEFTLSYHISLNDAAQGTNPIANPSNFESSGQTIFTRLENTLTGCYRVSFFDLAVFGFVIEGEPEDLYIDEGDLDGLAIFDLTVNETVILEGLDPSIHQITYYQTLSDSNNGVNSILTPQAYQNTANPQTIYVRVVNTESNGYALTSFQIETDGFLKVENQAFNDLAMYPNPTSEGVTISSSKLINETIVELFDISGKRLLSKKVLPNERTVHLDVSTLEKGVYIVQISSEGNSVTKKVIKK